MMRPDRLPPSTLSFLGTVYAVATFLGLTAVVLVIWPSDLVTWPSDFYMPRWARSLSDEGRFLAIAFCGGALGCVFKAMLAIANEVNAELRLSRQILNILVAAQASMMVFVAIRSFILLPTSSVLNLSPFGVLFVSFGIGWVVDNVLKPTLERIMLTRTTAALEERVESIANAVGVATLDNYQGHLCVEVQDAQNRHVPADFRNETPAMAGPASLIGSKAPTLLLRANEAYTVRAWFDPQAEPMVVSEEVLITGGSDVAEVSFVVTPDSSSDLRFVPARQIFSFDPRQSSRHLQFQFVAPVIESPLRLWLRATQKGRLVAVVALEAALSDGLISREPIE